ncbi:inositol-3-phosphate synthase [Pendulispora albinea]|uniref:Inositol-3-phosphate synthase n=1 Tax=Pendulispora albinea TaxID=2741071 RepID=A0ABZ2MBP9_9BACT
MASTVVAGVELMAAGRAPATGMLTETGHMPEHGRLYRRHETDLAPLIRDALGLVPLDRIAFSGWDVRPASVLEAVEREKIVPYQLAQQVANRLESIKPFPAVRKASSEGVLQLRQNIRAFREATGVSRVVVVDLTPTAPTIPISETHTSLERFEAAIEEKSPAISPGMLYFYAALQENAPYVNFTPNVNEIPALAELASKKGVPFAGRDGKSGQTFLKTVLAPGLRDRQLRVRGWFSANILGNNDGKALSDPQACATKVTSKGAALDAILGYPVTSDEGEPTHVVTIQYYPPRGDEKESWDSIDIEGFLGSVMQLKINFLCRDSILAAPLVVDLVRFIEYAHRRGEAGPQEFLGAYFKSPVFAPGQFVVHDFFEQLEAIMQKLRTWSEADSAPAARVA